MLQNLKEALVIDNGSSMCKAGFSGEEEPKYTFPSCVGKSMNSKELYAGEEALDRKDFLKLSYPMKHGIVQNWEDMIKIWDYCFDRELKINPSNQPCLLTQAPRNPHKNRQKMAQIMLEYFNIPAFYVANQALLSLYSYGRATGIVINVGDGVTHTIPVFEGYGVNHAIERNDFAGRDLTQYLQNILREIGIGLNTSSQMQTAREMKQKLCYVAFDYEAQIKKFSSAENNSIFELPDGQKVSVGTQRCRCPEALFNPQMIGKQLLGLHEMVHQSIQKCDIDIRKHLYWNIALSGGTTMFLGLPERLDKQITTLAPSKAKIKVLAPKNRKNLAWIGGSILTCLTSFQNMWITKADYKEQGNSILHKRCL